MVIQHHGVSPNLTYFSSLLNRWVQETERDPMDIRCSAFSSNRLVWGDRILLTVGSDFVLGVKDCDSSPRSLRRYLPGFRRFPSILDQRRILRVSVNSVKILQCSYTNLTGVDGSVPSGAFPTSKKTRYFRTSIKASFLACILLNPSPIQQRQ